MFIINLFLNKMLINFQKLTQSYIFEFALEQRVLCVTPML